MLQIAELPEQEFVWTVLMRRIEGHFRENKATLLQRCGLYDVFGPPGVGFTGEQEGDETINELTGQIMSCLAEDLEDRCWRARSEQRAGRPQDVLTREVGPKLLGLFLRFNPSAGRHSVWTSIDGKLVQQEAGPLFDFFKAALVPLNEYLVEELGWKPVSAARAARYAFAERRRNLQARQRRSKRELDSCYGF
jgi:hypothetical protein